MTHETKNLRLWTLTSSSFARPSLSVSGRCTSHHSLHYVLMIHLLARKREALSSVMTLHPYHASTRPRMVCVLIL